MTRNKARKTATRQRMAETGEPYSVARKATEAGTEIPEFNETPEDRYLREAEAAGVCAADLEPLRAVFKAQERADQLRRAADQARERADQLEDAADEAQDRADEAQDLVAEEDEPDDDEADRWHDSWSGMPRPPQPPRPPQLPRPPQPVRPAPAESHSRPD